MSKQSHDHGSTGDSKVEIKTTPPEKMEGEALLPLEGPDGVQQESSASATNATEGSETKPVDWEQKAAELEAKLAELNDQYLRKAADFENYRKRMIKEKQELTDFANQNLILGLLPVIDDFERAIKSVETSPALQNCSASQSLPDFKSFYEGVTMIEKRLYTDLENKWGLKRFDSEGQPFDPNRHEALQVEKAAGIQEAMVKEDYVKGYQLKDRVIRFAKVKVLMPDGAEPPAGDASS
jgi:molecular chaperone GrpE